jgi:hypothetical protein
MPRLLGIRIYYNVPLPNSGSFRHELSFYEGPVPQQYSTLQCIIFMHRCGPKGDEWLTPKLQKRAIYERERAMKYHMDNRIVNRHCGGMGMNLLPTASGKVGDNDASATIVEGRLSK